MVVSRVLESSILAFSAASMSRWRAWRSALRSTPYSRRNSSASQFTMAWSMSLPPRWVSPEVAFTSKTPSPISSTVTSKVPPPRSNTRTVSFPFLSRP